MHASMDAPIDECSSFVLEEIPEEHCSSASRDEDEFFNLEVAALAGVFDAVMDGVLGESHSDVISAFSHSHDPIHTSLRSSTLLAVGDIMQDQSAHAIADCDVLPVARASTPDCAPVLRMPAELTLEFFQPLDFPGRMAVTHVSRTWRRLAVCDTKLWNSVVLPRGSPSIAIDMLAAFLQRSDPRPFSVTSADVTGLIPSAVIDLIVQHMHRMELLRFAHLPHDDVSRLFSQKADGLRTLVFYKTLVLPAEWGEDRAPQLETLELGYFRVPATFRPVVSVRAFMGYLDEGLPQSFFHMFPNLTSLSLHRVDETTLGDLALLPQSIASLKLHSSYQQDSLGLDYSPILPTLAGLNLAYLLLSGSAPTVSSIVIFFLQTTRGECRMLIPLFPNLIMESLTVNVRFDIDFHSVYYFHTHTMEPAFVNALSHFTTLSLPLAALSWIYHLLKEQDNTFFCVRSLTVIIDFSGQYHKLGIVDEPGFNPINMPQLHEVTYMLHNLGTIAVDDDSIVHLAMTWLGWHLAHALPLLLSYPSSNVAFITLETEHPDIILQYMSAVLQLRPPRLRILNSRTLEVTELQDGEDATDL